MSLPDSATTEASAHEADGQLRTYVECGRHRNYRWWKPLVALGVAALILIAGTVGVRQVIGWLLPQEVTAARQAAHVLEHPWAFVMAEVPFLIAFLALFCAVRYVEGRRPGSLSSIAGRLRWNLLSRSCLLSLLFFVPLYSISVASTGIRQDRGGIWIFILLVLLLTPFQASIEEYVFRGWAPQMLGGWGVPAWLAMALPTALFTVGHTYYNWLGLIDVAVFGLCAGWLTLRTGGLEAAIGVHVVNNVAGLVAVILLGGNPFDGDVTPVGVIISVSIVVAYTAIADRWLRRPLVKEHGVEAMNGPFGSPKGNFGAVSALKRREVA
ncbi:MAG: CPBP family intramembrane metalloprotease [Actinomycetaceae bacterium]|nr:CPBP family intramembrane metalloprotease [Actinomycetaceae bacterium]